MAALGARLKAAREQRGISLREIAASTKISVSSLDALERDDYSRLPGGIFSRAFIRAYAMEVGVDAESTVNEFLAEVGRSELEAAAKIAAQPEVTAEDQAFLARQQLATSVFRIALAVVVIGIIALAIWQGPALMSKIAPLVRGGQPKPASRAVAPSSPVTTPAPAAASGPSVAPDPVQAPVESGPILLEFTFTADCRVQVSADGLVKLTGLVRAGERQQVIAQQDLQLDMEDGGAFTWSINGRPAKALGDAGVRRQAHITPATVASFLQ
jgi:cytoskeletal protein RodZ